MDERRTDTREQIRTVALEMFAEHGYDKTALREIAERLGVTKAAVYYHFKTKEEILVSLVEDFLARVDEIADWAATQPADRATRHEVLRRYSEVLGGRTTQLATFLHEGQAAIRDLAAGADMRKRFDRLIAALAPAEPTVRGKIRARIALITLHVGVVAGDEIGAGEGERREATLAIAQEITDAAADRP